MYIAAKSSREKDKERISIDGEGGTKRPNGPLPYPLPLSVKKPPVTR